MNHVAHIQKNKILLDLRWQVLKMIREFFWAQGFVEVETPLILRLAGQEPYLSPINLCLHNEQGNQFQGYLHTSPEYTMKKMLTAGYEKIFFLGKTFRDYESFGGTHNPEFTMLEFYQTGINIFGLMDRGEELLKYIGKKRETANEKLPGKERDFPFHISHFKRIHMRDLWKQTIGVDLDKFLGTETMRGLCKKRGYTPSEDESYEDLFYRIFLNEIEPTFPKDTFLFVHHYPLPMAALSAASKEFPGYAERFEAYVGGVELVNGFTDLTDKVEQQRRLENEWEIRKKLGKEVYDIDNEFLDAVDHLPPCAGLSLGIDRLLMVLSGCQNIDDVLVLPMSKLFDN